jgi:trigger factor
MSSEQLELKIAVQQQESWSRRLSITVPAERVRRTRESVASQISGRARMPGFRPGKIPSGVLTKRYGPAIEQETLDRSIQEAYREALETHDLQPITQGKIDKVDYNEGADLTFEVEFEVRPDIQIDRTSGFMAARTSPAVGNDEVDNVLERLRDERAEWTELEPGTKPDLGDRVTVEITVLESAGEEVANPEPRSYRFALGEEQAIPAVEESIMALEVGADDEFNVRFPDEFADESKRGQAQRLHIRLQQAERKQLPEIDDEFARAVGEFDSVAAMRERILTDLREDAERRAESDVRRQLIDQVIEANAFEVPGSMIERYLDHMTGHSHADGEGQKHEHTPEEEERISQVRTALRSEAEWSLKRMLVIERLAESKDLRASQDEIDAKVAELASKHERSESEVWLALEKSGQLEALEREITEDKVFEHLKSENTINQE